MNTTRRIYHRAIVLVAVMTIITAASMRLRADTGMCGGQSITLPFTDVPASNIFFCSIAEIYFQSITQGTTATTYSPANNVTREQMAAFLGRTLDTSLQRGSQRAALNHFWTTTPHFDLDLGITDLGNSLHLAASDGTHVWVGTGDGTGEVHRVRASDGKLIDTWTGAEFATGVLCAMGRVFVAGYIGAGNGRLYMIDPTTAPGAVTTASSSVGDYPRGIAFDGNKIWTANDGSVSIVTPNSTTPWSTNNVAGFGQLFGIIYDGTNMWVTEVGTIPGSLKKLNSIGGVLQTVAVGTNPYFPVLDGKNIWVPNNVSSTVTVVRASTGEVLATLSGNGLNNPIAAAFDGERILVTNESGDSVSLWKAADLTPLGSFATGAGTEPYGVCSDGHYFWVTLRPLNGQLGRF